MSAPAVKNKAGYTAIQSWKVWQGRCENRSELKNVTDLPIYRPTDLPTDTGRCRVACPRLTMDGVQKRPETTNTEFDHITNAQEYRPTDKRNKVLSRVRVSGDC